MEKCIFIGYPADYKGWKFYNPVTKKLVIAECAQFDERYFLRIKESTPTIIPTSLLEFPPTQQPSKTAPIPFTPPDDSDEESDSEDMYDHGGAADRTTVPTQPTRQWQLPKPMTSARDAVKMTARKGRKDREQVPNPAGLIY